MKASIKAPFFEVGIKNYIFGDDVLKLAIAADNCAIEQDIDVVFITPYLEIRRVAEQTRRLIVLAPYMDTLRPGRGMAEVLPEGLKAAGAHGVVLNHSERPMTLSAITATIERANELDLLTFACSSTIAETRAIAQLHPDIMNPEPSDRIGQPATSNNFEFMNESIEAVKGIYPDILVEQAAGIVSGDQVYEYILAGAEGAGAASGILKAADPIATMREMIQAVRTAQNDKLAKEEATKG